MTSSPTSPISLPATSTRALPSVTALAPRVTCVCGTCSASFVIRLRDVERGRGRYCSRDCAAASRFGSGNPKWRGGRFNATSGYVYVYVPGHPHATQDGYVMEHRLVMEKRLGRYLEPSEQVHHINHLKNDNRDENLELMASASEHRTHHGYFEPASCGSCGATITRSRAHRRKWKRAFCSRRCAALYASKCASSV